MPWILFAAAFLISFKMVFDIDIWWHMAAGRWMVENHSAITQDPFSLTFNGEPWTSITWGYELLLYAAHKLTPNSYLGLNLVHSLIAGFALLFAWKLFILLGGKQTRPEGRWLALVLFLLALFSIDLRWNHRPEMLSHLFSVLLFFLLWSSWLREGNKKWDRYLLMAWAIQLLWTNSHGIFAFGFYLFGLFALGSLVTGRKDLRNPAHPWWLNRFTLGFLGAALVCLLNPRGLHGALFPIYLLKILRNPFYRRTIVEGSGPFDEGVWGLDGWSLILITSIIVVQLALVLKAKKNWFARESFEWAYFPTAAALIWISLSGRRNIALLILWTLPFTAYYLSQALEWLAIRQRNFSLGLRALGAALAALFFLGAMTNGARSAHSLTRFGPGLAFSQYPVKIKEFLQKHGGQWRMFCNVEMADYLIYNLPGFKSYIDGRFAELYSQKHFEKYMEVLAHPYLIEKQKERWKFNVIATTFDPPIVKPFIQYLASSPDWKLVFIDHTGVVFVDKDLASEVMGETQDYNLYLETVYSRAEAQVEEETKQEADRIFTRVNLYWKDWDQWKAKRKWVEALLVLGEVKRAVSFINAKSQWQDQDPFVEHHCMALYMLTSQKAERSSGEAVAGLIQQTEQVCQAALKRSPLDISLHQILGLLYFNTGRSDEATKAFGKVLHIDSSSYQAHTMLAQIYMQNNSYPEARIHFERAAQLRPEDPTVFIEWARAADSLNQKMDAITALERAVDLTHDPSLMQKLEELRK